MNDCQHEYDVELKKKLLAYFYEFITPNKKEIFHKVIQNRTRYLTVILEDIYQSHNASAVLRSCDLTGIQDVHIIENRNEFKVSKDVALGASKWLNLFRYNKGKENTRNTIRLLKDTGYKIIATTPHKNDVLLNELPLNSKLALLFGTELEGLSEIAMQESDLFMRIPMFGFTESFNISVSAAITLHHLTGRLHNSKLNWQLTDMERLDVLLDWARKVVSRSDVLERSFVKKIQG